MNNKRKEKEARRRKRKEKENKFLNNLNEEKDLEIMEFISHLSEINFNFLDCQGLPVAIDDGLEEDFRLVKSFIHLLIIMHTKTVLEVKTERYEELEFMDEVYSFAKKNKFLFQCDRIFFEKQDEYEIDYEGDLILFNDSVNNEYFVLNDEIYEEIFKIELKFKKIFPEHYFVFLPSFFAKVTEYNQMMNYVNQNEGV